MATEKPQFNPGKIVRQWTAHDYHPHERGTVWMVVFCSIILILSLGAIIQDPKSGWVGACSLFIAVAVYFYIHRHGKQDHEVIIFQKGLLVDGTSFYAWNKFEGFWFVFDETVSVLNLELDGGRGRKISLQMGELDPDDLRESFRTVDLPELAEKRESLVDLWIRALKL